MNSNRITRKPIASTGAQYTAAIVDHELINRNKKRKPDAPAPSFPIVSPDAIFSIREHQPLLASKRIRSESGARMAVIGCANGLGSDIEDRYGKADSTFKNEMILSQFHVAGFATAAYDFTHPKEEGLTVTVAGTTTISAMTDIPSGHKLIVRLPGHNEMNKLPVLPGQPIGQVPIIVAPMDNSLPAHLLKQGVVTALKDTSKWNDWMSNKESKHVGKWGTAVKSTVDSHITSFTSFLYVLLQSGIVSFNPLARNAPIPPGFWRGEGPLRKRITSVMNELGVANNDVDSQSRRVMIANAVCTELMALFSIGTSSEGDRYMDEMKITPDEKASAEELKRAGCVAMFQDAESGKIYSHITSKTSGGINNSTDMQFSTAIGYIPPVMDSNGRKVSPAKELITLVRQGSMDDGMETISYNKPYFRIALNNARNAQVNHFTESVAAYATAVDHINSRIIGTSINGAKAGGDVDVSVHI